MTDVLLLSVNPLEVENCLRNADFRYPFLRDADFNRGWSHFAVIPGLYKFLCRLGHFPTSQEGMLFLMQNCDPEYREDEKVIARGQKLYMDFCRDVHTWGLLQRCPLFSCIWYQKGLDISMNVDYLASLLSSRGNDRVAVQAAMRARWPDDINDDPYEQIKMERRRRRGAERWDGPIYWLTNKFRPHFKAVNGCWLFGPGHITDLADEIEGHNSEDLVAIQTVMDF